MEIDYDFTARFFSNDSLEVYPNNTLSEFSCELNQEIVLSQSYKWEAGLAQIDLNPCGTMTSLQRVSKDLISVYKKTSGDSPSLPETAGHEDSSDNTKFTDMQSFVNWIMLHSLTPQLYTREYFSKYNDPSVDYSQETLTKFFQVDFIQTVTSKQYVVLNIPIANLLSDKVGKDIIPMDYKALPKASHLSIRFPVDQGALTMKMIVQCCIRSLLRNFSNGYLGSSENARMFFYAINAYKDVEEMNKFRRKHHKHGIILVHKFVSKFVDAVQAYRMKLDDEEKELLDARFLFLYTDILRLNICGSIATRLLHVTAYDATFREDYFHEKPMRIDYFPIEKTRFKNVSFLLNNEHGNNLSFASSFSPSHIALHFRRVANPAAL